MKYLPLLFLVIPLAAPGKEALNLTISIDQDVVPIDNLRNSKQIQTRMVDGKKQERRQLCATVHAEPTSKTRTCIGYGPYPLPNGENNYHCFSVPKEKKDICLNTTWMECGLTYNWHVLAIAYDWFPRFIRKSFKTCQ